MLNRIKGIIYDLILWLACIKRRPKPENKKALIVRVDEIGDYILWRKFVTELIEADILTDHEIHLCGNSSWKSLFDLEYPNTFHKTYWLKKPDFKTSMQYRLHFLKTIFKENYSIVINPTYSRAKRVDDAIVKAAKATTVLGMYRNNENYFSYEQKFDKYLYNQLFPEQPKPLFEFYRNKAFTEFILKRSSSVTDISFKPSLLPNDISLALHDKYFVVFPGSRSEARIWPTENFIETSNYIFKNFGFTAVVCGSPGDMKYNLAFINSYQNPLIDLTGKTNLPQLLAVLSKAQFLLSVDTGSVHLAASVGCTVFGIFNGSQYGRFSPYPKEVARNIYSVYPDAVEKDIKDINIVREKYEHIVPVPYSAVPASKIIKTIQLYFHKPLQNEV